MNVDSCTNPQHFRWTSDRPDIGIIEKECETRADDWAGETDSWGRYREVVYRIKHSRGNRLTNRDLER